MECYWNFTGIWERTFLFYTGLPQLAVLTIGRNFYNLSSRVAYPIPPGTSRGEWAWFGRQDSPGNSNISKMHKDRNASFNVHFQPRPMHVSSHNVFGLISSFSCHSSFSLFGMCGVIFQSANPAADYFKTYQFVLPLDQGRFGMIQSCEDIDIRYEICLLINYLFTVPMECLGSFRAVRGGDGSDVLFLCQYCELL